MSILEQLTISLTKPSRYHEMMAKTSVAKKIIYIITISVIVSIMTTLLPNVAAITAFGGFRSLFTERIPSFVVEDGKLNASDNFDLAIGGVHFYVDTEEADIPDEDLSGTNELYFTFGSEVYSSVLVQNNTARKIYSFKIADILPEGFDNDQLVTLIPVIYITLAIQFALSVAVNGANDLLVCLLLSLLIRPLARLAGYDYKFFDVVFLCYYADTLSILLLGINTATGYIIPSLIMTIIGFLVFNRYIFASFRSEKNEER